MSGAAGRHQGWQIRSLTFIAFAFGGKEARRTECLLGKSVSPFDADLAALDTGISLAQLILNGLPAPQLLLLTSNAEAINVIQKTGPHSSQPYTLSFE
jgi:hypothetical protein